MMMSRVVRVLSQMSFRSQGAPTARNVVGLATQSNRRMSTSTQQQQITRPFSSSCLPSSFSSTCLSSPSSARCLFSTTTTPRAHAKQGHPEGGCGGCCCEPKKETSENGGGSNPNSGDAVVAKGAPRCWSCDFSPPSNSLFCNICRSVQKPNEALDYFTLFSLPKQFDLDLKRLSAEYLSLQRQLHPDQFHTKREEERQISNDYSALLNQAYKTLKEPNRRAQYLLSLMQREKGLMEQSLVLPDSEFLTFVLSVQEEIEECNENTELSSLLHELEEREKSLTADLRVAFESGDFSVISLLVSKLNYVFRLEDDVRARLPAS
eukprot:TRINITY_DN3166_c0_g1_i3.p1 TRINITY_DN3166_c0_g1~~TRINITY_DN3166_c0_g1_i3.p1  ORF type:complete len:332 (+),score=110.14 TRINITY_DN3166_c0_g1_i3:34-996(+)